MSVAAVDPFLHVDPPPGDVRAVALVLHGGRARATSPVRARQLSVVRMAPFVSSLRHLGAEHGLAVARLRYLVRGWNGAAQSPVADVRWALDQLASQFPGVGIALVGHSMGARAGMYAGDHESVRSVVALAPWIEPGDPYVQLARRRVLIAHGDADRMTSAAASAGFARQLSSVAASVSFVTVHHGHHSMLRRAALWHALTTGFVLATMCDVPPGETMSGEGANVVQQALAGQACLVV